jgi:hypothetical protein
MITLTAPPRRTLCALFLAGVLSAWGASADAPGQPRARGRDGDAGQATPRGGPTGGFKTDVPAHPYDVVLGRPTDRAVTVSVLAYEDATVAIRYGDAPVQTAPVSVRAGAATEIQLSGLQAAAPCRYQVLWRPAGAPDWTPGPERTVRTQRAPGMPFTLTIQADSHLDENTDPALYLQTLRNAAADLPDFHQTLP